MEQVFGATQLTSGSGNTGFRAFSNMMLLPTTGALTVQLNSDGSVQSDGYAYTISCSVSCTGTPTAGTASISPNECAGTQATISVSGNQVGTGLSGIKCFKRWLNRSLDSFSFKRNCIQQWYCTYMVEIQDNMLIK